MAEEETQGLDGSETADLEAIAAQLHAVEAEEPETADAADDAGPEGPVEVDDLDDLREQVAAALKDEGCPPTQARLLASVYATCYRLDAVATMLENATAGGKGGGMLGKLLKGMMG